MNLTTEDNIIDRLLTEQRSLTAVERFAQRHKSTTAHLQERRYRDLIPLSKPTEGQQYSFEVDLDRCTSCKACVSACHSLNGLEENETWRDVGTLHGYSRGQAFQQTVTTACHHCVEPGCLEGCPVMAYDKDEKTGIVRHLDDQCIGCQYCTMKCPYDVPKYSKSLGIVRKCDMCHDRLAVGEAPACVQACPHEAIKIRLIDKAEVIAAALPDTRMLPDTYDASYTKPTTRYVSRKPVPQDAVSAYVLQREHAHWPLIIMLVLSQMAAGLFLALAVIALLLPKEFANIALPFSGIGFAILNVGLIAAVFHLGRPLGAWRFFLGLRTSWMSREILAFSIFAGCAFPVAPAAWFLPGFTFPALMAAAMGLIAVFTSAMIYIDTHREFWKAGLTFGRFYGTTLIGGVLLAATLGAWFDGPELIRWAAITAAAFTMIGFGLENARHSDALRSEENANHRSALIVDRLLPWLMPTRWLALVATLGCLAASFAGAAIAWTSAALVFGTAGLVLERYTFFTAVIPLRMPIGLPFKK